MEYNLGEVILLLEELGTGSEGCSRSKGKPCRCPLNKARLAVAALPAVSVPLVEGCFGLGPTVISRSSSTSDGDGSAW